MHSASPKTPGHQVKKPRLLDSVYYYNISSQSEVTYNSQSPQQLSESSPRSGIKTKSANDLELESTPVRIVKRHISSPHLNLNLSKSGNLLRKLEIIPEDLLDSQRAGKESDESVDLSGEDFDDILAAVERIDKEQKKNVTEQKENLFEDSFDDAVLNAIPLEELSKQCVSKSSVDILFDPQEGLSQVVTEKKPLARHSSDQLNKNYPVAQKRVENKTSLTRHNSLPQQAESARPKTDPPRLCTPAEIAEKKRLAQERLAQKSEVIINNNKVIALKRNDKPHEQQSTQSKARLCTREEIEEKRRAALERLKQTREKEKLLKLKR